MNLDLFNRVLAHIKAHPEEWDQEKYTPHICGSACCFAGHAVLLSGGTIPTDYERANYTKYPESVPRQAQALLDLTDEQTDWLFDCERTLEDFEAVAEHGIDVVMGAEE